MNAYHRCTALDQGKEHRHIICDVVWHIEQEWLRDIVVEAIEDVENEGNFQAFEAFFADDFLEDPVPVPNPVPNDPTEPVPPSQDDIDEANHRVYVMERRNKNTVRKTEAVSKF